jgi:hypothetical protein
MSTNVVENSGVMDETPRMYLIKNSTQKCRMSSPYPEFMVSGSKFWHSTFRELFPDFLLSVLKLVSSDFKDYGGRLRQITSRGQTAQLGVLPPVQQT